MKKEFNHTFFLNRFQAVDRVEVKTASMKGNPAFTVEGKHEFFPGRYESVILCKKTTLSEDASKEAVRVAYEILKDADRIAHNSEGAEFYAVVARRLCENGYDDLTALRAYVDGYENG